MKRINNQFSSQSYNKPIKAKDTTVVTFSKNKTKQNYIFQPFAYRLPKEQKNMRVS